MSVFVETINLARASVKSPLVMGYEVVIGFETHAQLSTQSKFSAVLRPRLVLSPTHRPALWTSPCRAPCR